MHITVGGQVNTGGNANIGSAGNATVRIEDNGSQWNVGAQRELAIPEILLWLRERPLRRTRPKSPAPCSLTKWCISWNVNDYLALTGTACLGVGCMVPAASVSVGDGAHVNTRVAQLGTQFGASEVFVDGVGSTWTTADQLYIGLGGGAMFMVTGGAIVTSGTTEIGVAPKANGTASVDASTWTNTGDFTVGIAGKGKLTVSFGGLLSVGGRLTIGQQGTVEGNSQIAATVRNGGIVAPGIAIPVTTNNLGTLHIDGDYTQITGGV